ncbi:MAG: LysM peptidoglycan-binding domain-containing protein, partial [Acetatifactor sp.]|nr:LysM peptidoglycan-binding domain-containing protein [Acetatifactor sp.]
TEQRVRERVRFAGTGYEVERGDSLSKIAREHGMSLAQLLRLNPQITDISRIKIDQIIKVK